MTVISSISPATFFNFNAIDILDILSWGTRKSETLNDLKILELYNSPDSPIAYEVMGNGGEKMLILADKALDGSVQAFTGGAYVQPDGDALYFWYGNDGLPKYVVSEPYLYQFSNYHDATAGELSSDFVGTYQNTDQWSGLSNITIKQAGNRLQVDFIWTCSGCTSQSYSAPLTGSQILIPVTIVGLNATIQLSLSSDFRTLQVRYPFRTSPSRGTYVISYSTYQFTRTSTFTSGDRQVLDVKVMSPGQQPVEAKAVQVNWKVLEENRWLAQGGLLGQRDPSWKKLPPGYYVTIDILATLFKTTAITGQTMGCIINMATIPVTGVAGGIRAGLSCGSLLLTVLDSVTESDLSTDRMLFSAFRCALGDELVCATMAATALEDLVIATLSQCDGPSCGCSGSESSADCDTEDFEVAEEDADAEFAQQTVYTSTGDPAFAPAPAKPEEPTTGDDKTEITRTAPAGGPYLVRLSVTSSAGRSASTSISINGSIVAQGELGCMYETYSSGDTYPAGTKFKLSISTGSFLKSSTIYVTDTKTSQSQTLYESDLEPGS